MKRNPKHPRQYIENPKKRHDQKVFTLIEFLAQFFISSKELLLSRLGLDKKSHHVFFKKMVERKILKRVDNGFRGEKLYMLGEAGKKISTSFSNIAPRQVKKPNNANFEHCFHLQKIIINRADQFDRFYIENNIPFIDEEFEEKKIPDACLEKSGKIIMIELELSVKSDKFIYRAFILHAESILKNIYQSVIYVFSSETLKNHYINKFKQEKWVYQKKNDKAAWVRHGAFYPEDYPTLRKGFQFIVNQ